MRMKVWWSFHAVRGVFVRAAALGVLLPATAFAQSSIGVGQAVPCPGWVVLQGSDGWTFQQLGDGSFCLDPAGLCYHAMLVAAHDPALNNCQIAFGLCAGMQPIPFPYRLWCTEYNEACFDVGISLTCG
jgi:hypothetical protein